MNKEFVDRVLRAPGFLHLLVLISFALNLVRNAVLILWNMGSLILAGLPLNVLFNLIPGRLQDIPYVLLTWLSLVGGAWWFIALVQVKPSFRKLTLGYLLAFIPLSIIDYIVMVAGNGGAVLPFWDISVQRLLISIASLFTFLPYFLFSRKTKTIFSPVAPTA